MEVKGRVVGFPRSLLSAEPELLRDRTGLSLSPGQTAPRSRSHRLPFSPPGLDVAAGRRGAENLQECFDVENSSWAIDFMLYFFGKYAVGVKGSPPRGTPRLGCCPRLRGHRGSELG